MADTDTDTEFNPTDIEALAMETGWAPKEEWRGEDDAWVDARSFIRQGRENLKSSLAKQDKRIASFGSTMDEVKTHMASVDKRAYDRAMSDLKARQREAVEDGEVEVYDALEGEIAAIEETAPAAGPKKPAQPQPNPHFDKWLEGNPWYKTDVYLTSQANEIGSALEQMHPELIGEPFFDRLSLEIRKAHPDRFKNPNRDRPGGVEDGGGGTGDGDGGGKPTGRTFADLPPEAKQACDRFVAEGIMDRKAYLETYDWDG